MTTLATTLGEQGRCLPALSRASESGTKLSPTPASQSHMRSLRPLIVVNQGRQTISGALVDRPIDTPSASRKGHYVNGPARELHSQRAKGARAVADQIHLRCKPAAGRQRSDSLFACPCPRNASFVAGSRRSAQNSREQVILDEIQCWRRSNVQPDAQRAGYGYQQVGSAVPIAD